MRARNVCTIPPACPFLDTFVDAFLAGDVVPGAPGAADDPLWLADARIFVPTQRSARALADAFRARSGTGSVVLPRILPLGALEATEPDFAFTDPSDERPGADLAAGAPLPPAASPVWRRLRLAALIKRWAQAIGGALRTVDGTGTATVDDSEAFRVATSSADAFALAGALADLIDEFAIEDVAWRALDDLRMAEFDDYWRITTTFLSIAVTQWPAILAAHGLVDRSARQIALVDAQARALAGDGADAAGGPVVAIGSTGSNRATARLLAAIAASPRGAVVLPGLDPDLDAAAWTIVSGRLGEGQEPSFGHPQAALARLLRELDVARADVRPLGAPDPVLARRCRFVAEALRPADTTERWRDWRKAMPPADLAAALAGVTLVEAADEREEALCLAIAMREILEVPGRTGALMTPDRELARRVRGELLRWNVEVADTGGEPLANRPLGVVARLIAVAATGGAMRGAGMGTAAAGLDARGTGALLAHPLAVFGRPRQAVARLAAKLEVGVLRTVALAAKSTAAVFAEARALAGDHHAHPAQAAIDADDWAALAELWDDLAASLTPLMRLRGEHPLEAWVAAHRIAVEAVTLDAEIAADEDAALADIFAELEADAGLTFDAEGYGQLFARVAAEAALRNTDRPHPCLQIFGLIEARLMTADVVLLGGLDETIWPPPAQSDPFLNRPMRHDLGLSPPERRIGQTAHDFAQAMGNRAAVLSRAAKRGGSPCVPSRFLLRLGALGGAQWEGCRARGARLVELARLVDRSPVAPAPAKRPRPTPPMALRPVRLSVTQVETLRRDPYTIHAAHILKLQPLPQVGADLDPAGFGSLMHRALHEFTADPAAAGTPAARRAALEAIVRRVFAEALQDPVFAAFRWPIIARTMELFLGYDAAQRETAVAIATEFDGRLTFALADLSPFTLTARADRIDRHRDGSATLIDYKTGQPPGLAEVQVGFAPQLTLEAVMLREGGFGAPHMAPVAATYLKLGGRTGGAVRELTFEDESFEEVARRHFDGLKRMLSSFRDPGTGYPSRPYPKYARSYGDFDHLARVREWSLGSEGEGA